MATHQIDMTFSHFLGLRQMTPPPVVNPATGQISAYDLKNVELKNSTTIPSVGICSMSGRKKIAELEGKTLIDQFESTQLGVSYWIVYAVDETKGYLYHFKPTTNTFELIYEGLTPVHQANGITLTQGFDDVFVFTNGVDDYLSVNMTATTKCKFLNATDAEGRDIRGLCLKVQDGRLITNSGSRVHWSRTSDIYDWSSQETGVVTNPVYQEFDRDITAIETYGDALVVFTASYSVQFSGNPGDTTSFRRTDATGGGCAGYKAIVKFANKLFYYDAVAKDVFTYYLYDSGQTRPSDGFGSAMMKYWNIVDPTRLNELTITPVTGTDRSELWFSVPLMEKDIVLVYDSITSEWVVRDMGPAIAWRVIDDVLYCANGSALYRENIGDTADGEFYQSMYACHTINLGSDSNTKIPKMPLILTLDDQYSNNFTIEIVLDEDPMKTKTIRVERKSDKFLIWANEDGTVGGEWAEDDGTGGYYWHYDDAFNKVQNVYKLVPFKQMRLKFYTEQSGDSFGILKMEMKRVKVKTKTIG